MKYALFNGRKTHASQAKSGDIGNDLWYPSYEVVACVGKYRQYWKYTGEKPELPNGYEPETEWHAAWKMAIKDEHTEVICGENREHRADIKTAEHVIEIQKSPIDGRAVIERNQFYNNLTGARIIWIVNVEKPWKEKRISTEKLSNTKGFIIKWKYHWRWVEEISLPNDTHLFLDFKPSSDKLIKMWSYKGQFYGLWIPKIEFFRTYLSSVAKQSYLNCETQFQDIFKEL